jgi:hypothetical protein
VPFDFGVQTRKIETSGLIIIVAASSSAERNWATYKWMKTKKRRNEIDCQGSGEGDDDDEDFITNYVISSTLHDCIRNCPSPHNDCINIISAKRFIVM